MPRYRIECSSFKKSGKFYTNGLVIDLGLFLEYPAGIIRGHIAEFYLNLDKASNLPQGAVQSNGLTVLIQVLDDTDNPIVYQELVI